MKDAVTITIDIAITLHNQHLVDMLKQKTTSLLPIQTSDPTLFKSSHSLSRVTLVYFLFIQYIQA